jgi:tetratricopeptide (TPR) repeat protein
MFGKKLIGSFLFLFVVVTLIYANHFHNSFHFDDSHTIENNPYIRNIKNIPLFFKDGTTSSVLPQNQSYRPLVSTTLAIDYWIGKGYNLFYFHLSTFIVFLLQGLLMFFLFRKIIAKNETFKTNLAIVMAFLATTWYLLHPANAETVNYVIARSDILSTFFVVLAFVLYACSSYSKKYFLYLIPIIIGGMAKPTVVMFAPMLLMYVVFFEEEVNLLSIRKKETINALINSVKKTIPAFVVCILLYVFIDKLTPKTWEPGGNSALDYLITQPFVILHYFVTFFWPTGLSADSDWSILNSIADIRFVIGTAFILGLVIGIIYTSSKKQLRPIGFGIAWFLLALVPTSSIIPLAEVVNDHRMYFPFIGLVFSVTYSIFLILKNYEPSFFNIKRFQIIISIFFLTIFSLSAYGTVKRNQVWHTEESLWKNVTLKSPLNGRGLMNYGLTQMEKGNYAEAEKQFNKALILTPNYASLYINLAIVKKATGDKKTANEYYLKAIELKPNSSPPHYFYGLFLSEEGKYNESIVEFEKALNLVPSDINTIKALLNNYQTTEQWGKLNALAKDGLLIDPDDNELKMYLNSSLTKKSILDIENDKANVNPTKEKFLDLSLKYFLANKFDKSIDAAKKALEIDPNFAEAYNNLGSGYINLGQYNLAISALNKAISLKPDFTLAINNLKEAKLKLNGGNASNINQIDNNAKDLLERSLIAYNNKDYILCINLCKKAIAIKPNYVLAYNNICASYNELRQFDNAIKYGKIGLSYDPEFQLLKNNLAAAEAAKKKN